MGAKGKEAQSRMAKKLGGVMKLKNLQAQVGVGKRKAGIIGGRRERPSSCSRVIGE